MNITIEAISHTFEMFYWIADMSYAWYYLKLKKMWQYSHYLSDKTKIQRGKLAFLISYKWLSQIFKTEDSKIMFPPVNSGYFFQYFRVSPDSAQQA